MVPSAKSDLASMYHVPQQVPSNRYTGLQSYPDVRPASSADVLVPSAQYMRRRSATAEAAFITGHSISMDGHGSSESSSVGPVVKMDRELKKMSLYKTELCRSWEETGTCRYGTKCQFAHSRTELRPVDRHPKYKTEMCKTFWEKGACPYGKRCCFIHTENAEIVRKDENNASTRPVDGSDGLAQPKVRARTMSSGSNRNANDTSPGSQDSEASDGKHIHSTGPRSVISPPNQMYDHRAIAEAYFSGRRASNEPVPASDEYNHISTSVDRISMMLRNSHVTDSQTMSEKRRPSIAEVLNEQRYGDPHSDRVYSRSYGEHQHLLGSHVPPRHATISTSTTHAAMVDGGDPEEAACTSMTGFATPPRERTRRSRSVTQPTGFFPTDGRPWGKNRSESFSGYLPGTAVYETDYYGQGPSPRPYHSANQHQQASSTGYYGHAGGQAYYSQQQQQLLSPPPSGHPSPVRETIEEEDIRREDEERLGGQRRRRTQSFGHRLPIFANIKRTVG
ncbi:hypothetical protein HKX48_003092 [Thoreauomyces humboldtii]|nr:hypothetical protein HKX48_003092 [Thoreauomyces humboldtii]